MAYSALHGASQQPPVLDPLQAHGLPFSLKDPPQGLCPGTPSPSSLPSRVLLIPHSQSSRHRLGETVPN